MRASVVGPVIVHTPASARTTTNRSRRAVRSARATRDLASRRVSGRLIEETVAPEGGWTVMRTRRQGGV